MEVKLGLLAEYANVAQDGKLNVMGIFDRVMATQFPVTHPSMYLVLLFSAGAAEWKMKKELQIRLMDQDGAALLNINGQIEVPEGRGTHVDWPQIVALQMMQFKAAGSYEFHVLINQETRRIIPLNLELAAPLGL